MPILVFLGEVGLGAQRRQREEAGACTDRRQRRGLQPHRQWGQRQGQSLQLGQLVGLELLLQGRGRGALAPLGPPVLLPPAAAPEDPKHTRMMEFSSGAVTCLALSMAPKTCCWCWMGTG